MTVRNLRFAAFACALLGLALVPAGPLLSAPLSAWPVVKLGEAKGGYVGALDVVPLHGKAGETFTIKGDKLPPNQEFQLIWRTVNGRWNTTENEYKGREFTPVDYAMGTVKSDAQGRFSANFTTPDDFGFDHDIVLQQGDRLMTQVNYSVDMTVDISPKSGPIGTPITGSVVFAAMTPARCAAAPAAAMISFSPRLAAVVEYSCARAGVRCAESTSIS